MVADLPGESIRHTRAAAVLANRHELASRVLGIMGRTARFVQGVPRRLNAIEQDPQGVWAGDGDARGRLALAHPSTAARTTAAGYA